MSDAIVRVHGLVKRFPGARPWRALLAPRPAPVTALAGVSLEVARGELFGLLGPNGAGKSTLFRVLATTVLHDEGELLVDGHDVRRAPAAVREVLTPVPPEERSLQWRLSAEENLRLFAALLGEPWRAAAPRARALLERFGLAALGVRACGTFSSGQRQRLLLARALLGRPRVLLLDEPTRSLDPVAARDFRALVRAELCQAEGITVLLATHSAEEAFGLCDRVGVLDRGRLIAEGRAAALAAEVRDERLRLVARGPVAAVLSGAAAEGAWTELAPPAAGAEGWIEAQGALAGGPEAAARLVARLVAAGVEVAAVEPQPLDLATLVERLVERSRAGGPDA